MNHTLITILTGLGMVVGIIIIGVTAFYFWPETDAYLQRSKPETVSYQTATDRWQAALKEEAKRGVLPEKQSRFLTHNGSKAPRTVVMFHGITADPSQFAGLAKQFFDAGYNVYIPLAPHHGTADKNAHGAVTSHELVDYVNQAITTATGLGNEVGVVGLSGGGVLATWAAQYRPEVSRALVLSPFYEPAAAQAPKWQLPFLRKLYGGGIIPDTFTKPATPQDAAFSYHALGNYLTIVKNLRTTNTATQLKQLSAIISDSDDQIDLPLAHQLPSRLADENNLPYIEAHLPADWNLKHDIVSLDNKEVAARQVQLFKLYHDAYEGRKTTL